MGVRNCRLPRIEEDIDSQRFYVEGLSVCVYVCVNTCLCVGTKLSLQGPQNFVPLLFEQETISLR